MEVTIYKVENGHYDVDWPYVAVSATSVGNMLGQTPEEALSNYLDDNWQHNSTGTFYDSYINNPKANIVITYSSETHPELFI